MDGTEILKEIRKIHKLLPVVVVTSHSHKKDIAFFEKLGANLVIIIVLY